MVTVIEIHAFVSFACNYCKSLKADSRLWPRILSSSCRRDGRNLHQLVNERFKLEFMTMMNSIVSWFSLQLHARLTNKCLLMVVLHLNSHWWICEKVWLWVKISFGQRRGPRRFYTRRRISNPGTWGPSFKRILNPSMAFTFIHVSFDLLKDLMQSNNPSNCCFISKMCLSFALHVLFHLSIWKRYLQVHAWE